MEKTNPDHQHQQPPLRCPRCDSSNTKFCYYNNYSLSQPRHFCKACKRYWTRGGTLRNVPVGGGCRKNKRVKRQAGNGGGSEGISISSSSAATASINPRLAADLSTPASNHISNPLFYGLSTNPLELNFPFSSLGSTRVSTAGFDLQHQMNGLGLGFPGGMLAADVPTSDPKNGFKHIHDVINSSNSPYLSSAGNNSIFFGSSSNFGGSTSTSTMASLLASGLQHQKYSTGNNNDPHVMAYGDNQMNGEMGKELKLEGEQNRLPFLNSNSQINSSDSSSLVWNTSNVSAWFDPSNIGSSSSVPSLI